MDFNEIEKAYAMGRAYAQGLKYAKLMAKLNTVAQDTMKDGFATLVDSEGQPYVANLNRGIAEGVRINYATDSWGDHRIKYGT